MGCVPLAYYFQAGFPYRTSSKRIIFNKGIETTVYATMLAIPNYRLKAMDKTVITFSERPAGGPEALRASFYPGRNWGKELVHPKAKAIALSKASPILFTFSEPIKLVGAPVVMRN